MAIRNIKRWQWILVSLFVGLTLGYFQQSPNENWQTIFGDTITQQEFEDGLTRKQNGQHWFRNIVIYPKRLEVEDKTVNLSIVTGEYFNGSLELQNGQRIPVWHPRCYIAETPFHPITPMAGHQDTNTIITYLQSLPGVSYTYAWWWEPNWSLALWTAGSFVVIGLLWPTIVNLLIFGSIRRPKEKRGIDLSKVSAHAPQSGPRPDNADLSGVAKMADEIEAKLGAEAGPVEAVAQSHALAPPVTHLSAASLNSNLENDPHERKDYGQDKDDFYPTEVHKAPPDSKDA
jgi:hypothetical protein